MPIFNDIDLKNWKESEIWTDSLWIISERDKTGKHSGFYHGNFVPQIPRQLILRYRIFLCDYYILKNYQYG